MVDSSPLKIAVLSEIPTPYRVPVYQRLTQDRGVQLRFFFCSQSQADRAWPVADYHALEKVVLRGWQFQRKGKNTLTTFFNPEIISQLRTGGFDLVIIGGWAQPTMLMALVTCWFKRIPYVLHSESHAGKPRFFLKRWLKQIYPGVFIRMAKGYLVTGSAAAKHLMGMGAAQDRIFVFPNTIDVESHEREAIRLQKKRNLLRDELKYPGEYSFLFVGRLVKVKGIEILLEAFDLAHEELPDWGLVVVGDGPLRSTLMSSARHKPWREKLLYLPYLDPAELIRYYVAADAFVLPSLDEPWGVVVNEAMAAGLPILLSQAVGAAEDLLEEGKNGFLHPTGEVAALAKHMIVLGKSQELRTQMGMVSSQLIRPWGYEKNQHAFRQLIQRLFGITLQPKNPLKSVVGDHEV